MKKYDPILEGFHHDECKEQLVYRFPNNYGASVVRGPNTHGGPQGLWELAVIRFYGSAFYEFEVDFTTGVTNRVIGNLAEDEIDHLLTAISALSVEGVLLSA